MILLLYESLSKKLSIAGYRSFLQPSIQKAKPREDSIITPILTTNEYYVEVRHKACDVIALMISLNTVQCLCSTPNASQELPQLVYKTSPNKYTVHCSQSSLK
jgi:hypothetical protein